MSVLSVVRDPSLRRKAPAAAFAVLAAASIAACSKAEPAPGPTTTVTETYTVTPDQAIPVETSSAPKSEVIAPQIQEASGLLTDKARQTANVILGQMANYRFNENRTQLRGDSDTAGVVVPNKAENPNEKDTIRYQALYEHGKSFPEIVIDAYAPLSLPGTPDGLEITFNVDPLLSQSLENHTESLDTLKLLSAVNSQFVSLKSVTRISDSRELAIQVDGNIASSSSTPGMYQTLDATTVGPAVDEFSTGMDAAMAAVTKGFNEF